MKISNKELSDQIRIWKKTESVPKCSYSTKSLFLSLFQRPDVAQKRGLLFFHFKFPVFIVTKYGKLESF